MTAPTPSDALVFFSATGTPVYEYEPNSWGPREVEQRVSPPGNWQKPVVTGLSRKNHAKACIARKILRIIEGSEGDAR